MILRAILFFCIGLTSACSVPDQAPPGRDVVLLVTNSSDSDVELEFASGTETNSTEGGSHIAACSAALVSFGQAHEHLTVRVDGEDVLESRVPVGGSGHLVATIVVDGEGRVSTSGLGLRAQLPADPPQPACAAGG